MKSAFRIGLVAFLLVILFGTSVLLVSADAAVSQFAIGCSKFSASGTSNAPFVTIFARNQSDSSIVFVVVPVTGGHYAGSVSYPAASTGTSFAVQVWGSLNTYSTFSDPGYYDGGTFFDKTAPCTESSGFCLYPLPSGSVVYNVPQGAPAYYDADLNTKVNFNLPAGTWEISEVSGDFAQVWIACSAEPIWIPKSAVGAAVG